MINEKRLLWEFLKLVQIDSETTHERWIATYLKEKLHRLGLHVEEDDTKELTGCSAGNLICTFPGTMKNVPKLYFTAHMDTASPGKGVRPRIDDGYVTSDGSTILGADDKAGLAAMIEVIHVLRENDLEHGDIQFIMTVGEEAALAGARVLDMNQIQAQFGYTLDGEGKVGTIVTDAPALATLKAVIYGKSHDTRNDAEKGLSAIRIATQAIHHMSLGHIDGDTTAQIIRFTAGQLPDADLIELICEVRSMNDAKLFGQIDHMESIFHKCAWQNKGRAEITYERLYPPLSLREESKVVEIARQAALRIGRTPRLAKSRDGSDANIFSSRGIPTAVLGVGYEKIHTTKERMPLEELYKLAEMVLAIIMIVTSEYGKKEKEGDFHGR